MVLTEKEKSAASQILNLLSEADVVSLAKTVTKGHIVIGSRKEADRAVIVYSDNLGELLRRKIVRREVLFKYSDQEHVNVKPNDPKLIIIQQILCHLGSQALPVGYAVVQSSSSGSRRSSVNEFQAIGPATEKARQPPRVGGCWLNAGADEWPSAMSNVEDDYDASPRNSIRERLGQENNANYDNQRDCQDGQGRDFNWWNDRTLRQSADDQEFAAQFTAWFYQKLNSIAVLPDSFGSEHFFTDATLHLLVVATGNENSVERFSGADLVVRRLVALVSEEQLLLNANYNEEGVRGMSDPHGRRVVFACGTVHRGDAVLGLFEQQFGLVRDPTAENSWKICSTRLALSTRTPSQVPTLTMTQNMLTI